MAAQDLITDADRLEQYALTGLARIGIPFERATQSPAIVIALDGGIRARRRVAALRAREAAIPHQVREAA